MPNPRTVYPLVTCLTQRAINAQRLRAHALSGDARDDDPQPIANTGSTGFYGRLAAQKTAEVARLEAVLHTFMQNAPTSLPESSGTWVIRMLQEHPLQLQYQHATTETEARWVVTHTDTASRWTGKSPEAALQAALQDQPDRAAQAS